ncbi:GTPase HflX [Hymenobacter busanensis]|uniref:GTPase HflX n=1 Tax=Hymenobacter busanensis TaxID=2607656 RepID=A0A7L4ZYF6_9BACT|nr:GTPase HflX [Hymenobacter busanensis]KAA9333441.1 GTPase HflX [Hymenobacter busanensis]QHJ07876.1 GTPase HflX [Hymenobacter busanensis]
MAKKPASKGRPQTNSTRHPGAVDGVKGRVGRILTRAARDGAYETAPEQETAVLVAVPDKRQDDALTTEYLDELAFLTETAGTLPIKRFIQKLEKPDIRTYVGSGKLEEIRAWVQHHNVSSVIFDDDLSPSQLRNLEKELQVKILDRTLLIIDIFALRAKSATARTQVELAQYQYLLPRLTGLWTHLDKQRGGVGMRGPGEREIETDRRVVRDRIALLKEQLKDFDKQNATQRKARTGMVRLALVGYTNVGKSTLMNLLSRADVFAENKLFATVDSTVRKVVLDTVPFLLSDTVGFIRKLPTRLIESFKSTLDEIREADLLLHVVDISHPSFEDQIQVVNDTLKDIGAADKPVILVFNKIDQYQTDVDPAAHLHDVEPDREEDIIHTDEVVIRPTLEQLQASYMARLHDPVIFISAQERQNIDELRDMLARRVRALYAQQYPGHAGYADPNAYATNDAPTEA